MKKGWEVRGKARFYGVMGVLVLAVLGMDLAAWAWERAGSNFFHTQGRVFIGVNAATSSHGGDANAYLQVHNPESNPNNMEVARFTARVGANRMSYITVGDPTLDPKGTQGYLAYGPSTKKWHLGTHFQGPSLTVSSLADGGFVGIGVMAPTHPLHLKSGAHVTAGGIWSNASSRSLKENLEDLSAEKAMEAFGRLNPVVFNYRSDRSERHVGFVAEDVPELLASRDRKGLSPMDMVAVLTKVVQEQQKLIAEQRQTLAALSARVEVLEDKK